MNKFALVAIAGVLSTSTAFAADLGYVNQAAPAAAAYTSASSWSGFYAGVNGGYGWAEIEDGGFTFDELEGIFGGAQVGYNYDFGGFVLGIEGDIQLSDIGYEVELAPGLGLEAKLDYFGTVRARAGYAFDAFLPYVTGGLAYGGASIEGTGGIVGGIDDTFVGYTIGAGLEVAVADNVSVKGEYLYTDFGDADFDTGVDINLTSHVVRLGVNYRF